MKWISVKDKLPPHEMPVLAINKFNEQQVCFLEKKWESEPQGWWTGISGCSIFYPTHWMPLPEPPKAEE